MTDDASISAARAGAAGSEHWIGIWTGSFGARTDLSLIVSDDGAFEIVLLGHPVQITRAEFAATMCMFSGSDIALTLERIDNASAQGSYVNAAGRKATALFRRA